ncbi:unnamed protein product [Hapterophycus canaliculatus]
MQPCSVVECGEEDSRKAIEIRFRVYLHVVGFQKRLLQRRFSFGPKSTSCLQAYNAMRKLKGVAVEEGYILLRVCLPMPQNSSWRRIPARAGSRQSRPSGGCVER